MHHHRTAGAPPAPYVMQGLGVCDAVRVVLGPVQLRGLLAELEELRAGLEQELGTARAADRAAVEHDLACVRAMRTQAPGAAAGTFVVVGPGPLVAELVGGAARDAADRLAEAVRDVAAEPDAIQAVAAEAAAWAATWAAHRALERYTFDPAAP